MLYCFHSPSENNFVSEENLMGSPSTFTSYSALFRSQSNSSTSHVDGNASGLWNHFHQYKHADGLLHVCLCETEEPSTSHQHYTDIPPGNPSRSPVIACAPALLFLPAAFLPL